MSAMVLKAGEVISIASGIYEAYDRDNPFTVMRDFVLELFVDKTKDAFKVTWRCLGSCMKSLDASRPSRDFRKVSSGWERRKTTI